MIDRTIDFQSVLFSDHKIVMAMARRSVYTAGSRFAGGRLITRFADVEFGFSVGFAAERDVLAHHQKRWPIQPGVTAFEPIKFAAGEARQHF